ncbi:core component of ECF transporter [Shewanella intestini]|uniref:Core component of ECF transporter n=1 Tax=Shewanella intestini TaxID=2017544 RepID=A0ABS5HZU6_9GAMM|nr:MULTISPECIES: core component of ECF transporter [Shewanella]MBR9727313.1 core component of ECF transporter [Shewanella intestini]MRG35637.1 core component of ECF transporter [Shewanella sp. XMDDZSB0408]
MKLSFNLQDALFIGFCATLLVAIKSMMRLKLGLSGHSMLLMTFFYLICYGVVGKKGCITVCGLVTGILAMMLSVGKGGPVLIIKFGLPALAMDLTLLFIAGLFSFRWQSLILAATASIAWGLKSGIGHLLAGMTLQVALAKFGLEVVQGGFFALIAALLVPSVLNRLQAHDLVTPAVMNKPSQTPENHKD